MVNLVSDLVCIPFQFPYLQLHFLTLYSVFLFSVLIYDVQRQFAQCDKCIQALPGLADPIPVPLTHIYGHPGWSPAFKKHYDAFHRGRPMQDCGRLRADGDDGGLDFTALMDRQPLIKNVRPVLNNLGRAAGDPDVDGGDGAEDNEEK